MGLVRIYCKRCNKEFTDYECNHRIYCSKECRIEITKKNKKHICKNCGNIFYIFPSNKQKYCSISCAMSQIKKGQKAWNKGKKCPQLSGKNHWNWKGGKDYSGRYIQIYMPEHPYSNYRRKIYEHRLIMEKILGRILLPEEQVHHMDYNPKNNNPENLISFESGSKHITFHKGMEVLWGLLSRMLLQT